MLLPQFGEAHVPKAVSGPQATLSKKLDLKERRRLAKAHRMNLNQKLTPMHTTRLRLQELNADIRILWTQILLREAENTQKKLAFSWHCHRRDRPPADALARKTLALKANHLLDLKAAKNDLITQLNCPNFPDSLWLDVLANRFIDLDKVFSGYYSLKSDHRLTKTIDNVNITLSAG
jgi:hypothetical protein